MTIYWHGNNFLKKSYIVTRFAKERVFFLKINATNDILFIGTSDCHQQILEKEPL
jgi:hypothetical protein